MKKRDKFLNTLSECYDELNCYGADDKLLSELDKVIVYFMEQ